MTCFHPVQGYRGVEGGFVPARKNSPTQVPMQVPCGRCMGCRIAKSKEWAFRMWCEAQYHDENCFVTLTYSDEHLPSNYSVNVRDVQLFLKRLRKLLEPRKIRYYACGEYGDKNLRPHYHLIIFGHDFNEDKIPWRKTGSGALSYRSPSLESVWGLGQSEFSYFNRKAAGYVARYSMKKLNGHQADAHYERLNPLTGEICKVEREFGVMSNRPGLGGRWFEDYERDCFPNDYMVVNGEKTKIPRYYSDRLKGRFINAGSDENALVPKDDLYRFKQQRKQSARERADDATPERLAIREEVLARRVERLKRDL